MDVQASQSIARGGIAFRVDAGPRIGLGHFMRCATLALQCSEQGSPVLIAGYGFPESLSVSLQQAGITVVCWQQSAVPNTALAPAAYFHSHWLPTSETQDAQQFEAELAAWEHNVEWIVVDHYALAKPWEKILARHSRVMAIDDLADRPHSASVLLDQTFQRCIADYKGLLNATCRPLLGTQYALLREEFIRAHHTAIASPNVRAIEPSLLISMGGADSDNVSGKLLTMLEKYSERTLHITVIVGAVNAHKQELAKQAEGIRNHQVSIVDHVENISGFLLSNSIAIGAPGGSSWERCACGIPTLLVTLAENQKTIAKQLVGNGCALSLGPAESLTAELLHQQLTRVFSHPDVYQSLKENSLRLCDAHGTRRVFQELFPAQTTSGDCLYLRKITEADIQQLFVWQNLPETRRYARNPAAPSWSEHQMWMKKKLAQPFNYFYRIDVEHDPAGMIRLDRLANGGYEISIFVAPEFYQRGVAITAIRAVQQLHREITIYATVKPENIASQRLFEKAKFKRLASDQFIWRSQQ
ncbi:UDP-2,4-diacetamido-2,4,6-trideoxy-beta-L-altropyranose hydrolase [Idiomarina tyrosinivorans]|uniref:UDP-2,4-diacetamido-2,4, 6-trideoxy-beta-L-altropyranose hydrolase n=1 Tax=Idiomarina tyrosinivorans TaxID=1445662 RepID=A0A432ZPP2_9GAMM|nr:UDP-2,4-diacetamido-2,4,6-trideoxy-beta-L-altropyranose hydrolase [Idiomarina tyrosinivorans]RUO79822.1 UDP-2,4-diacetamido-2,4,6-trideoxy-beta-L-altropyranose hydrolase [Idiomarina tyrosinivorans]